MCALSKFRPYVYGSSFKVVTNTHPLCWLANLKTPLAAKDDVACANRVSTRQSFTNREGNIRTPTTCHVPLSTRHRSTPTDTAFVGAVTESETAAQQRTNTEFRVMIEYFELRTVSAKGFYAQLKCFLPEIFGTEALSDHSAGVCEKILETFHDEPSSAHLGTATRSGKTRHNAAVPALHPMSPSTSGASRWLPAAQNAANPLYLGSLSPYHRGPSRKSEWTC